MKVFFSIILTLFVNNLFAGDYIGCFKDKESRDMSARHYTNDNMTNQWCKSKCKSNGFTFAATQYGTHCFCDNSYGQYGKSNSCNMDCGGSNATCGGEWANQVYLAKPKYLGCYKDKESRDLSAKHYQKDNMTNNWCNNKCGSLDFKYAATQYGTHCFCDDSYGQYGRSNSCNMDCGGSNATCGGEWANKIYKVR